MIKKKTLSTTNHGENFFSLDNGQKQLLIQHMLDNFEMTSHPVFKK